MSWHPSNGATDQRFHVVRAADATEVGEPVDTDESVRVEWMAVGRIGGLVCDGLVGDGLSVVGLLSELAGIGTR